MPEPTDQPEHPPEPQWRPPRDRDHNLGSVLVGLILLAIGGWYLLDQTFGFDMPRIRWADLWPIILILVGALTVARSLGRRS